MALIDELKERRGRQEEVLDEVAEAIKEREEYRLRVEQELDDLDRAIAALAPVPEEVTVNTIESLPGFVSWVKDEQPGTFEAEKETAREQLEREDDASEFAEPMLDPEFVVLDEQTCEPVEERPALNPDMQDEREQPVTDVAALIASGEHSYDEVAAIAYPEPQWNEPAPVTNPEADALAKAHDWYDPKAVHDRQKFNPFGIFGHKRETEDA